MREPTVADNRRRDANDPRSWNALSIVRDGHGHRDEGESARSHRVLSPYFVNREHSVRSGRDRAKGNLIQSLFGPGASADGSSPIQRPAPRPARDPERTVSLESERLVSEEVYNWHYTPDVRSGPSVSFSSFPRSFLLGIRSIGGVRG